MPRIPIPPNSNVAQQIKDVVEQNARMFMDEWMKNNKELFGSNEVKLKIQNVQSKTSPPLHLVGRLPWTI